MEEGKLLILGASGMLGKEVVEYFSVNTEYQMHAISRTPDESVIKNVFWHYLDITDTYSFDLVLKEISPSIIINCAANVNIEFCEKYKDLSDLINSEVIKTISLAVPNSKLVYISTDSVFDGHKGSYTEEDEKSPLNNYAKSKLKGEEYTLNLMKDSIVIRTNIYGLNNGKGRSLVNWILDNLSSNNHIYGYVNVYFNPVYTKQLAKVILELIQNKFVGELHVGSDLLISKYDFIKNIISVFGFNEKKLKISKYNNEESSVKRPLNTTLSTTKLFNNLGYVPSFEKGILEIQNDFKQTK